MIRKQQKPAVAWAFGALGAGVLGTVGMWAHNFAGSYWRLSNGNIMHVDAGNALPCLLPWQALDCRAMFVTNGYPDLAKLTSMQMGTMLPLVVGAGLLGIGVYQRWLRQPDRVILSGPTVAGMPDLVKASKQERGPRGLRWFGKFTLSRERESQGFLLLGAPNSGKTFMMLLLAERAARRGDKIIAYANKTELVKRFPPNVDKAGQPIEPILIAPHDLRSWIWDIAKDVAGEASAATIADILIPEGDLEFFTDASRAICAAMILKLHRSKPHAWTWAELLAEIERPTEELIEDAKKHYPPAMRLLTAEKRQLSSTLSTLQNAFNHLRLLAIAWPDYSKRNTISARQFILGDRRERTLILGRSGDYPRLSDNWIRLFLGFAAMTVQSSDLAASKERRTWFMLDEFGRLPKVEAIEELIVTGREKGVPVVLGLQDMHQVEKVYGPHEFKIWMSSLATKVICRTEAGDTTKWIEEILGSTWVRDYRYEPLPNGQMRRTAEPPKAWAAFSRDEFGSKLGVHDIGVDVLLTGVAADHFLVRVPFEERVEHRPDYEPAPWVVADRGRSDALDRQPEAAE